MSKLTKIMLGAAVPLLLVGGFTAFAGWHMGADAYMDVNWRGHEFRLSPFGFTGGNGYDRPDREYLYLSADELPAFQGLAVDLDVGDVTVQEGGSPSLDLSWAGEGYQLHHAVENGILRVWSTGPADRTGTNHCEAGVVLTVPEGTMLTGVDVEADVGDVWVYGVTAKDMDLSSGVGDVTALDVKLVGPLRVAGGVGDVDVSGALEGEVDLSADVGDLMLSTDQSRAGYTWDLSTGVGELVLDGEIIERQKAKGGTGEYPITAKTDVGDVLVYFTSPDGIPAAEGEQGEIVDLPRELFRYCPEHEDKSTGMSAGELNYDFTVNEATSMTIDVENLSGELELGIKKRTGFGWAYEQRVFGTESDTVELAPGQYSLVIHADAFQGSYHLVGETI